MATGDVSLDDVFVRNVRKSTDHVSREGGCVQLKVFLFGRMVCSDKV